MSKVSIQHKSLPLLKFFLNYLKIGYFCILIELIKINHLLTYESPCITKKVVGHTYNSPPPSIRTNYQVTKVFSFLNIKKREGQIVRENVMQ